MKRNNTFKAIYDKMNSDDALPSRFPYVIDVELTNKCNLSCNFCSRQFMKRPQGFMIDSTFGKIMDEIEEIKIPIRFIRWGEPFLHPKILTYANNITKRGIPLHITTNGLLLNEETCEKLIVSEIDSIIFSMQGANKDEYKSSRVGGDYDLLSDNIKNISRMRGNDEKPYMAITTTISQKQGKNKEKFIRYWKQYVDDVKVGVTNLSRINNFKGKHIICKEPWQKFGIDWDGEVSACCGDYDRLMNIGNINEQSLYNLWNNNSVLDSYRNLISYGKHDSLSLCSKCYPAHGNVWEND